jgi:hypothetical protein
MSLAPCRSGHGRDPSHGHGHGHGHGHDYGRRHGRDAFASLARAGGGDPPFRAPCSLAPVS